MPFRDDDTATLEVLRVDVPSGRSWEVGADAAAPDVSKVLMAWSDPEPDPAATVYVHADGSGWSLRYAPAGYPTASTGGFGFATYFDNDPPSWGLSGRRFDITTDEGVYVAGARVMTSLTAPYVLARATAPLTLSNAADPVLIPGLSTAVTTGAGGDVLRVEAVVDFDLAAGAGFGLGELFVDGAVQPGQVILNEAARRATATQRWAVTGLAAGAHTVELRARKTAAGAGTARGIHSVLEVEVRPA